MEKNRLFTFGCSHTQYIWPSWANILGLSFKEFYNFGLPGSGTFFMLYQFTFAHEHFKFNENDTLLFMLSDEARIDVVKNKKWLSEGLAFNSIDVFGNKFFEHYSEIHAVESSYVNVYLLKQMLDKIGCKYEIFYAFEPFFKNKPDLFDYTTIDIWNKTFDLTNKKIKPLTEFGEFIQNNSYYLLDTISKKKYIDGHFTISTHLEYVKKYFLDYHDIKYDSTVNEWETMALNSKTYDDIENKFKNIVLKNKVIFVNGVMDKIYLKPKSLL